MPCNGRAKKRQFSLKSLVQHFSRLQPELQATIFFSKSALGIAGVIPFAPQCLTIIIM
jgi:hypothetical protein